MKSSTPEWDENCQCNIEWIGQKFSEYISASSSTNSKESINMIYAMLYRFVIEMEMTSNLPHDLVRSLDTVIENNRENIFPDALEIIDFARYKMPTAILKHLFSSDHVKSIKNIIKLKKEEHATEERWKSELETRGKKVEELQKTLVKYESAFNFVVYTTDSKIFQKRRLKRIGKARSG
ncbi:hypothetical protein D3C84_781260 [compost metagenome]